MVLPQPMVPKIESALSEYMTEKCQQDIRIEGFDQQCRGAELRCAPLLSLAAVSGDENDRQSGACQRQLFGQFKAAHLCQADVNDSASRFSQKVGCEKILARRKAVAAVAGRIQQVAQGRTHAVVVIDYRDREI